MPVISQWKFRELAQPILLADTNRIIYDSAKFPNQADGTGTAVLSTPDILSGYGQLQQGPDFIQGSKNGFIQAGGFYYPGSSGSIYDLRAYIQSSNGGWYTLRVYVQGGGKIYLGIGTTPPGAYGLTGAARGSYIEQSSYLAMSDMALYDPYWIRLQWGTEGTGARPVINMYGGAGPTVDTVSLSLSLTADYSGFPAYVPEGHTPPFDATFAEAMSISPAGLYRVGSPLTEQALFYGPDPAYLFAYIVQSEGQVIAHEQWEPPDVAELTSTYEDWESSGTTAGAVFHPQFRAMFPYMRWR